MKDGENKQWNFEDIAHQYKIENPEWDWKKCCEKAKIIYKELNRLNYNTFANNRLFFKMNKPFSAYEYEDKHLSFIPELDEI